MKRIAKYEWDRMSNEEVIDFWEEHDYATVRNNRGKVPMGFSSIETLDNFSNCEKQMLKRGLL